MLSLLFCSVAELKPTSPLVTELLQLPVPGYGTVYRHISETLIADLPYSQFRRSIKTFLFG